jgi:1,2-diacylglycerol 3-alpha-glucosyltransferase
MKLGLFSESYYPSVDGVSKFIQDFKEVLTLDGFEVYVYTSIPGPKEDRVKRISSLPFPLYEQYWLSYFWIDKFIEHAKKDKIDVVHIQTPFFSGIGGIAYARNNGIPIVGTFHSNLRDMASAIGNSPAVVAVAEVVNEYSALVYNNCDIVTVPTRSMLEFMRNSGLKTKTEIIPPGLNLKKYENFKTNINLREYLKIPEEAKIILYLGRITIDKGVYLLLNSFEKVRRRVKDVYLIYAGTGPEIKRLRFEVIKRNLSEVVRVLGYVSEDLKASLLKEAYLQVLPSRGDTFGLVLAEGMAFGKVVIASNKGGMKDWVKDGETGLIFNMDEENGLEEKIEYALMEDLTQMGENAKKWVLQNLDIKVVTKKFEEIYERLKVT